MAGGLPLRGTVYPGAAAKIILRLIYGHFAHRSCRRTGAANRSTLRRILRLAELAQDDSLIHYFRVVAIKMNIDSASLFLSVQYCIVTETDSYGVH